MEPERTTDPALIDFKKKFDLTGKVIIVTGACGLIGRAFCEAIAQFGGMLVVADIEAAEPEKLAKALSARYEQNIQGRIINVEERKAVADMLAYVLETFGKIDGLVNAHQNKSHLK